MGKAAEQCFLAVLAIIIVLQPATGRLVAFGDSLSDNGSGANGLVADYFANNQVDVGTYPLAPYYQGHFTNGPIWLEVLANLLDLELVDYAVAGATSGATPGAIILGPPFAYLVNATALPAPPLLSQVESFIDDQGGRVAPKNLYSIFIGSNDYMSGSMASPADVVGNIAEALSSLYAAGGRIFLIPNLPPFQLAPAVSRAIQEGTVNPNAMETLDALILEHNAELDNLTAAFANALPDVSIIGFDTYTPVLEIINNGTAYGLTGSTMVPCYQGTASDGFFAPSCTAPDTYFWWDGVHPTAVVHKIFGNGVANTLAGLM